MIRDQLQFIMDEIANARYEHMQSIALLMEWGFKLQGWMAYSGSQESILKKVLQDARAKAFNKLSEKLSNSTLAASLQKDYINDLCSQENADYLLAERTNRACVHASDFIRTCISALKVELSQTH